jgi:signal transduction histidine kinase
MASDGLPRDPSILKERIEGLLDEDRSETDESLQHERDVTDRTVASTVEQQVDEALERGRERIDEGVQTTREKGDARLGASAEVLPEVASTLQDAAESLTGVAENLSQAADDLTQLQGTQGKEVVGALGHVAQSLAEIAGRPTREVGRDVPPKGAAPVAQHLADVADSLAEVAGRVAEERESADASLNEERTLLDEVLEEERKQSDATLELERESRQDMLEEERRRTDRHLMSEREDTDHAVQHAIDTIISEQVSRLDAEQRAITREEFLAIVSHDLRAPLDAIVFNADLLAKHSPPGEDGDRHRKWATNITRASEVMNRLLTDLLDVARFEGGEFRVVPEVSDVARVVRECVDAFGPLAHALDLRLDADLPGEEVRAAYDHDRILQVLSNLVRNAIQFTKAGGSIRVILRPADTGCLIAVSDTGAGIPEGQQGRIFERFQQLRSSHRSGLGLGLYISKRIVAAHGGRIWVESRVGAGSTFYVSLPGHVTTRS